MLGGLGALGGVLGILALSDTSSPDAVKVLYVAIIGMLVTICFGLARLCSLVGGRL